MHAQTKTVNEGRAPERRAARILAKSLYRDLTAQGYDERQIVALATELIGEVAQKMATTPAAD